MFTVSAWILATGLSLSFLFLVMDTACAVVCVYIHGAAYRDALLTAHTGRESKTLVWVEDGLVQRPVWL